MQTAQDRRPDDPDHHRHAGRRRRRQRRRRARVTKRPGHRRAGDGRARHRRGEGARPVPADGPQHAARARRTSTTRCRRSTATANGFQAGSTFKVFVLAAAIEQGIPLNKVVQRAGHDGASPRTSSRTAPASPTATATWEVSNYDFASRADEPLHRHPGLGEHLLRPARAGDRHVRALRDGQAGWASSSPTPRGRARVWRSGCRRSPWASRTPARWRWPRPTRPSPPAVCTATPGRSPRSSTRPGNLLKEYASKLHPGDGAVHRRRGQRRAARRDRAAASPRPRRLDQPAAGKTGTTQGGKSVWFIGYTPQLAAAAMIAGANEYGTPRGWTARPSAATTRYGLRLRRSRRRSGVTR